ncbi:metallophosphoesterase [Nocardia jiangsuensis]|uniref:Metallophosphoesterase n=1 Tax=Nocardia jiangsuensis TaxID=1691563 RepID=A0ABV8E319_9NOCA
MTRWHHDSTHEADVIDWYTADLHIGHRLLSGLRGFPDIPAHDDEIARRWDALVSPDDRIWVLGDISVGGRRQETAALDWIARRPGEKHLITGNHDGCHPMRSRAAAWQAIYLASGFTSVQQTAVHKIGGQRVTLSHFPFRFDPDGDHTPENRFEEWRVPDIGQFLLHGHTHSEIKVRGRQIHVGLDAHDLRPVTRAWVAGQMSAA